MHGMEQSSKTFRSRISVLLIGLLALFTGTCLGILPDAARDSGPGFILGGAFLFALFISTGMRYTLSGNSLYVRIWFIPYGKLTVTDIVSVKRTYNPLSSPAASLKRLRIRSANRFWLVSPVREEEFIEELKAINPEIYVNVPVKKGKWHIWDWDI
jgi:hypothetical protein